MNVVGPREGQPAPDVSIEYFACTIQRLPADIRWLHAVPEAIQAIARGTPLRFGPRTRFAATILSLMALPAIERFVACAISFTLLLDLYVRQLVATPSQSLQPSVLIGVGALRETKLLQDLTKERGGDVSYLNETSLNSFSAVFKFGFWTLWHEWSSVARAAWKQLGDEDPSVGLPPSIRRIEFLTQAHKYTYLRAWFRQLANTVAVREPVVFSAASIVAYAAISVGVRAAYHLHGFQRRSLVYPDFDEVLCFTIVEARNLERRLPCARVRVAEEQFDTIITRRSVAIAGCYGQTSGFDECAKFVGWASSQGIPVVIRAHPRDTSDYFDRWKADPNVSFADTSSDFDSFLERYRPRVVLSWYSTALYDALRRGVVPVTVTPEAWRSADVVFPFREISLALPGERCRVEELMSDDHVRSDWLSARRLLAGIGGSAA